MAVACSLSVRLLAIFLGLQLARVRCDVYMHNPRGSNNRLNSRGVNRRNNNRLFDSQNNAKGGYNVGDFSSNPGLREEDLQYNMKYFMSGSKRNTLSGSAGKSHLVIEWTNQHGCGNQDLNCDIILQYKCQDNSYGSMRELSLDTMRNGQDDANLRYRKMILSTRAHKMMWKNRHVSYRLGQHESWEWYDKCARRDRNKGLFTADQKLKGSTSIYTRQNPNGQRSGYECPEERDYYPYWHPTDWKDIAVLATSEKHCEYLKKNSFNTQKKGECLAHYVQRPLRLKIGFTHYSKYNNPTDCKKNGKKWVDFTNFLEERPDYTTKETCEAASTKEVPLVWGVPYVSEEIEALEMDPITFEPKKSCLVQLPEVDCRKANYSRPNHLGNAGNSETMNYTWVLPYFPSGREKRCVVRIRYNISTMDYDGNNTFSDKNGDKSPVKNNPEVSATKFGIKLQLAVNTAQYGRTFQDRSHVMILKPREGNGIPDETALYNLNVRGKRGNIVQVYPAVEYDFTPNDLILKANDAVHIQWTGSNHNPRNNAGQGARGTDRSNIVQIDEPGQNTKFSQNITMFEEPEILWKGDRRTQTKDDVIVSMATSEFYTHILRGEPYHKPRNRRDKIVQDELNNASPSNRGAVLRFPEPGDYYYMCTRNNNFSNRNQKAHIKVIKK